MEAVTEGGVVMATNSIYKSVNIKEPRKCKTLLNALERSSSYVSKTAPVTIQKSCSEMTPEQMKAIWKAKK